MLRGCLLLLAALSHANNVQCQIRRCVVVAPRSIRSYSNYTLSIATHGAAEPLQFRVKIYERDEPRSNRSLEIRPNKKNVKQDPVDSVVRKGPKLRLMKMTTEDKYSKDVKVPVTGMKTKTVTVQPDTPHIIKFNYDRELSPGSYVLEVVSLSSSFAPAFYEKQFLTVESESFSIFIQTNKASYRPGDTCKYRIVIVDADTRPVAIESSLTINVYDSTKTLVHIKSKQSAKNGVFSGEFQITARGKNGIWQLEAEFKGKQIRKQFEITKTERPNFQVIARTPTFVSNNSTQFSVGVECYYTFGKPIIGTVVVKVTPILQSNNSWVETAKPVMTTGELRGIHLATFQMADFKIPNTRALDSFLIETAVQEKATGAIVRGHDKTIPIDFKRNPGKYDILLYFFGFFLSGQTYSIKVHVHDKSGMALPADMQSVKLAVAFDSDLTDASSYTTYDLDGMGRTEVMVQVPLTTASKIHFRVKHGELIEEATVLAKQLLVQVINPSIPKLNQKIQFQVGCREVPRKLSYYIVGRGNVLVSQVVDMVGKNVGVFEFDSTLAMAPTSSLVVYFISDTGEIISDNTEFTFEPDVLANPLNVTVSETRLKPNQELTVTLKTGDNSKVLMSAVDQTVLLESQGNDLSRNKVLNGLRLYDNAGDMDLDASYSDSYSRLLKSGSLIMTDANKFRAGFFESTNITTVRRDVNYDYTADLQTNIVIPLQPTCSYINLTTQERKDLQNTTSIRSKFADTLLWQDVEYGTNLTTLKTTVPETMTSWVLTGYSLSATAGLGLIQTPLVLTTFKPFFIDVKVPSSSKMGAVIDVLVVVHNYMDQIARVEVTLDDSAGDFDIVPSGRALSDYMEYDEYLGLRSVKQYAFQVVGDGVRSVTFLVKPKKVGAMTLKVQTVSSVACDTLQKTIMIEPPGRTITRTITRPMFLSPGQIRANSVFEINMPPNAVPGSMKVLFNVQGDKYSLTLENQQPLSADGEDIVSSVVAQTMNVFGPAATLGCQSADVVKDTLNMLNNSLMNNQCPDGGSRTDGDCDQPLRDATYTVKILLASAVAMRLKLIGPDPILKGLDWLANIQRPDGSFPNPNPYPAIFVEGPRATSYVLFAFAYVIDDLPKFRPRYNVTINKAVEFLFAHVESLDILSLIFLCRSAQLTQDTRKKLVLDRLNRMAFKNELAQQWASSALLDNALPEICDLYRGETDIVTLYRVANGWAQYMVDNSDRISTAAKLLNIVNLNYCSQYLSTLEPSNYLMNVTFTSSSSSTMTTVLIDYNNRALQSTFELAPTTNMLNVSVIGSGLVTLEISYEYNLLPENVLDAYSIQLTLSPEVTKDWLLNVCVSSKLTPNPMASVMEIQFPPGFNTSQYVQNHDAMTPKVKNKDLKGNILVVKLEGLDDKPACFNVPLYRIAFVEQSLVGTVTVQDQDLKDDKPHFSSADYTIPIFDFIEIADST